MGFFKTNERKSSIYSGGSGISSRAFSDSSRQTLFIDSLSSLDGIPTSIETGKKNKTENDRRNIKRRFRIMKERIFSHPITLAWCIVVPLLGAFIQGIR